MACLDLEVEKRKLVKEEYRGWGHLEQEPRDEFYRWKEIVKKFSAYAEVDKPEEIVLAKKNGKYKLIVSGDGKEVKREVDGKYIKEIFGRDVITGTITVNEEKSRERIQAVIKYAGAN